MSLPGCLHPPVFSPHPDSVRHSESKNSPPPYHKGSPLCSCVQESADVWAVTHRKGLYCRSNYRYFLNWWRWRPSDWEWTEGCVCAWVVTVFVCVWVRGLFFGLRPPQRGPMCCYQPLGLWDWQMEPRNKSSLFISWNKCVSQSGVLDGGCEALGMCITAVCSGFGTIVVYMELKDDSFFCFFTFSSCLRPDLVLMR